jgi:hypothetical protein
MRAFGDVKGKLYLLNCSATGVHRDTHAPG